MPMLKSAIGNWQYFYSYRSAFNGSTRVARRAGTKHAIKTTRNNPTDTATNVTASVAVTSKSNVEINLVNANDATSPATTPATPSTIPLLTTSLSTSKRCAPSAIRTPISCVRCKTEYDITP